MQAVRCDACGMKALVAASQCPHCGHLLELRNSFGDLLPLAHCGTCDSWYPEQRGSCRWCGTPPETMRIAPYAWKGVGVLAFVGMAVGVWLTRDADPDAAQSDSVAPREVASAPPLPPPPVEPAIPQPTVVTDTQPTAAPEVAAPDTMVAVQDEAPAPSEKVASLPEIPPAPIVASIDSKPAATPPRVVNARQPVARRTPTRWKGSVARSWVTLRAAPARTSRIVGSIGPDTRVQLGESRGEWTRVRTRGVSGWAERSSARLH
jgi:hypothetical protein